jgi:hypothetical protein
VKFGPAIMTTEEDAARDCAAALPGQWVRVRGADGTVRTGRLVLVDQLGAVIAFGADATGRRFAAVRRAVRAVAVRPVSPAPVLVPVLPAPAVAALPAPAPVLPVLPVLVPAPAVLVPVAALVAAAADQDGADAVRAAGTVSGAGSVLPVPSAGSRILRAAGSILRAAADAVRSISARILRAARGDPPAFRA